MPADLAIAEAERVAQNLARNCGWAVFPCTETKAPAIPGPGGYKHASRDPDAIATLWRRYPGPLIGIATGAASGFSVLDLDQKHATARTWWAANLNRLLPTRAYASRSGGLHLHFRHREGVTNSQNRICWGVDTRGEGGYIIAWFAAGFACHDHSPPAPWPEWLLAELTRPKPEPQKRTDWAEASDDRALAGLVRRVEAAKEGERNAVLFWAACRCVERGMRQTVIEALLLPAAMQAGLSSTLEQRECRRTIASAMGRAAA